MRFLQPGCHLDRIFGDVVVRVREELAVAVNHRIERVDGVVEQRQRVLAVLIFRLTAIIGVETNSDKFFKLRLDSGLREDAELHVAAVLSGVAREVNQNFLTCLFCLGLGFLQIAAPLQLAF